MSQFVAGSRSSLFRTAMAGVLSIGMFCMTVGMAVSASAGQAESDIAAEDSVGINMLEPGTSFATPSRAERKVENQDRTLIEWNSTGKGPPKGSPKG